MSGTSSDAAELDGARKREPKKPASDKAKKNIFSRIALFVRQVIAELKQVVTPNREELINYVVVVLVFVLVSTGFVALLDYGIGKGVLAIFGTSA